MAAPLGPSSFSNTGTNLFGVGGGEEMMIFKTVAWNYVQKNSAHLQKNQMLKCATSRGESLL
jgi:hypothetical protein